MSGHSKWSKIKRQKGVADQKKGVVFTKLAKNITFATKQGGGDLEMNFKLRLVVDKARQSNMPKDNIERAIKKGTGVDGNAVLEEAIYEGFGPEKIGLILEVVTDNKNRTAAELKHILNKHGGAMGAPGSVSWMFNRKGVIILDKIKNEEETEMIVIDSGADDFKEENDELIIYTIPEDLEKVKKFLENKNLKIEEANIEWIVKDENKVVPKNQERIMEFFEILEENEDVQSFYSNVEI